MRMMVAFVLLLMVAGCDWFSEEFEAITVDELNKLKCEWQNPHVSKWFYAGNDGKRHVFVHRDSPGDMYYEIKIADYKIDEPKHFSSNQVYWEIMPWGPKSEECRQ